jgi:glycosyltransferase involved in cell wall biosynthesis
MMADVYKPHISGVTNYIALNKAHLEKMGHTVYVFTFGDLNYQDDEGNIIRSPGIPLLDTGFYINLRYTKYARQLLRSMDVVHVHHPFLSGSLALSYCKPRGIPVVFTNHTRYDLYAQAYLPVLADIIGETTMAGYLPVFCRNCDLVVAPSAGLRDVLVGFGVDATIEVVPNGVDLRPFQHPVDAVPRAEIGFGQDDVVLIYVGRLGPEKNINFLLRSFAGAIQAYDNIRLMIVGDGPERENLHDRVRHLEIAHRIYFSGFVAYEHLPRYLACADAFVTASVTEVHPLSVIEAMASGLPVLGIRSPGVGDTIEGGVTGLLAPSEDMAAFTAKMIRLATDRLLREEMGARAREAANQYAIERTTEMMVDRYTQAIQKTVGRKSTLRARLLRAYDRWAS